MLQSSQKDESLNMLSLALRVVAITSGLFGIIACAQISAAVFANSIEHSIDTEKKMSANTNSRRPSSSMRPTLKIDTSVAGMWTNNHVIVEVFPRRRPSSSFTNAFSNHVVQFMTGFLNTLDDIGSSRRATRLQRRLTTSQNRWTRTHVECPV